jgi:tetratricopeptide (TPR) repeat protein
MLSHASPTCGEAPRFSRQSLPMNTRPDDASVLQSSLPPAVPDFVGRADLLADLHHRFTESRSPLHRVQAIHGLGGVGKTQAAVEYARRHANEYSLVCWVRADSPEAITLSYGDLAMRLGRHVSFDAAPEAVRDLVATLLEPHRWLMIFDDAPGARLLQPLMIDPNRAGAPGGHVLITSRNTHWAGVADPQPLSVLSRAESMLLLRRRSARSADDDAIVDRLAQALGDLPLALTQAAALIRQTHISFADYLTRFESQWASMLLQGARPVDDYPQSVAMAWGLSFKALTATSPIAAELLNFAAFLNPDRIVIAVLQRHLASLPPRLRPLAADPVVMSAALEALLQYSLVDSGNGEFSLHRLVAMVTRDRLDESQQVAWCTTAINFLADSFTFDSGNVASWANCGDLLPHVVDATQHAERLAVLPDRTATLLNDAGRYLLKKAQYVDAKRLFARAMALCSNKFGSNHPRLSAIANNLGRAHENLGDDALALQYFGQALTLDEAAYGHAHPHVAEVINNYGICMVKRGDRDMARQQFQWAAQVYEAHYGSDHPKLAHILNNLGYALKSIGDNEGAQINLLRALTIAELSVGPEHPTTARILYNLASVLRSTQQLPAAREYLERALMVDQNALGPNHPDVGVDCAALAELLGLMRDPAAAAYQQRAQRIQAITRPTLVRAEQPTLVAAG